jgi:MFS family permease
MQMSSRAGGILGPVHRPVTVVAVLGMSVIAFEALAVTTMAPLVADDLGGVALYGWVFSAFLLAQIVGTVAAGQQIDGRGVTGPFVASLTLFGLGLATSGVAPTMPVLILGRALQGLGAGGVASGVYALVNAHYPDRLRPRMLASISSAYVLPSLAGPTVAAFVAERYTWRAVFLGFVPLLVVVILLSPAAFRRLSIAPRARDSGAASKLRAAVVLACGAGALLAGLQTPLPGALALVGGGAVAVIPPLRRLLPEGTFRARRGLPAILASRGMFIAGFFCTDAFLVLALTARAGYSVTTAGLTVSAGSLSWTTGSWIHERLDARSVRARRPTLIVGVGLMFVGIAVLSSPLLLANEPTLALAVPGWMVAGLGIGLAHSTSSTVTFALTPEGREGEVASLLQLVDFFVPGVAIGLGGAFVDLARSSTGGLELGLALAFALSLLLVACAFASSLRVPDAKGERDRRLDSRVAERSP